MFSVSKSTDAQTLFVEIVADPLFDTYLSDMYFFFQSMIAGSQVRADC